jgi:hypothetical protein
MTLHGQEILDHSAQRLVVINNYYIRHTHPPIATTASSRMVQRYCPEAAVCNRKMIKIVFRGYIMQTMRILTQTAFFTFSNCVFLGSDLMWETGRQDEVMSE